MNILITGAGSGLGKATAEYFAARGDTVIALDIRPPLETGKIKPFTADITDESSLLTVRERLSASGTGLDCIINFAGMFFMDNFLEVQDRALKKIVDVNFLGAVRVNKIFFPLLRGGGKIIIATSEVAPLDPLPFNGIYSVTKTALDCYAQALRQEAGLLGVRVITVRPGAFNTPLANGSISSMREMAQKSSYFGGQAERFARIMTAFTGKMLPPERLAGKIYTVARKKHPRCVYTVHANPGLQLLSLLPKRAQVSVVSCLVGKGRNSPR